MPPPPTVPAQELLIYLSTPAGEREGPYTLDQINKDLAEQKYQGNDYWAWYEGLTQWIPLPTVPGIREHVLPVEATPPPFDSEVLVAPELTPTTFGDGSSSSLATETEAPAPEPPVNSGLAFTALEQIFILTTGDGQAASRSPLTISLLQDVIGEDWATIREVVPRDAIAKCTVLTEMGKGPTPPLVWRAMTAFKPLLLKQAREGQYRICIRTFQIETGDVVSVFLFYNKQKLK